MALYLEGFGRLATARLDKEDSGQEIRLTIDSIDQAAPYTILGKGLLQPGLTTELCEVTKPRA